MNEIPYGYCQCGCGQKTNISRQNDHRKGAVKGKPRRFVTGHGTLKKPLDGRFWTKVDKSGGEDACWNWTAGLSKYGYGKVRGISKMEASHRVAYELTYGKIPDGLWVLHKCDNPPCCNPKHLFLGTHVDNVRDKVQKGRQPKGENNPAHKLTENDVRIIRQEYSTGNFSYKTLGAEMGVSAVTIRNIVKNRNWITNQCEQCGGHGYISIRGDEAINCERCNPMSGEVTF